MSDKPKGARKFSDLSDDEKRAHNRFGMWGCATVLAGTLSLALLVHYCLVTPKFRLSLAIFWGSATIFVVLSIVSRLAQQTIRRDPPSRVEERTDPPPDLN